MVALVRLTANRNVMGEFANTQLTNAVAVAATAFFFLLLTRSCYSEYRPMDPARWQLSTPEVTARATRPLG